MDFPQLIDLILVFWLRFGRYPWSRFRRRFERRYLSTPLPSVSSIQDIDDILDQVQWTMDGPLHLYDSISYPQTTWAKKRDDCDGFAVLAAALLRQWDSYTCPLLLTVMVRPVRKSHTVCVFTDGAACRFFDTDRIGPTTYESYLAVAQEVGRRGHRLVCWDVADPRRLCQLEFHRP